MGVRYTLFRLQYELSRKTGLLRRRFPVDPPFRKWITLEEWKRNAAPFLIAARDISGLVHEPNQELHARANRIRNGELQFFSGVWRSVQRDGWCTNPETGYQYPLVHWTKIPDFSSQFGDIKYVWEPSRFLFIQDIIRDDFHHGTDSSAWVWDQMESWITHNPINCGPNYRCSQETSLRLFNWIYALYFYRDSASLTNARWEKILFHMYWQFRHVQDNIDFSRIAVRNNHAITETLALYIGGTLFPFFDEASTWRVQGKKWFEEEIAYQIYEDGTYLQFSNNYHRVVVQLLTLAINFARVSNDTFGKVVYQRAYASLNFLLHARDKSGWLPNYGANDGSLFFRWNDGDFRDQTAALNALHVTLTGEKFAHVPCEDVYWFHAHAGQKDFLPVTVSDGTYVFPQGGIYICRQGELLVWINCVRYKDRPSQADNLHLDVFYKGINILRDAGSFQYNTDYETVRYFSGTESHNTIMLGNADQMKKAGRFIWLNWSQAIEAEWQEVDGEPVFKGSIAAFTHLGNVVHTRTVTIRKNSLRVSDQVTGIQGQELRQLWHPDPRQTVSFRTNKAGEARTVRSEKWYSPTYGVKEAAVQQELVTDQNALITEITFD